MKYWYELVFYGLILFALLQIIQLYVLKQDILLNIIKYFKDKNESE